MTALEVLVAVVILVGILGVVVPILPGPLLVLAAILVWSLQVAEPAGWVVLAVATLLLGVGAVVKYVVPGRRLQDAGIPARTQWAGVLLAVVGFFVVPVLGLFVGFVLGIYLAERVRVGRAAAWPSTRTALRAVGLSILIELLSVVLATATWVVGVVVT
jgi:uncharacterized protein YqgC (DUF456 family)